MSLYAVKNDEGEWLDQDRIFGSGAWAYPNKDEREKVATYYGGRVVKLVEAPAKVVVTQEEADKLERAKVYGNPADVILALAANHHPDDAEHILRAYVLGWTVEKPNQYGVWVPHVKGKMYYKDGRGSDDLDIASADCLNDKNQRFTAAEIEHYGLGDCKRVEVTDDEQ